MKRNNLLISALLVLAILIGLMMENLKVNINYILEVGGEIPGFFDQSPDVKQAWIDQKKIDAPYDYYYNHRTIVKLYDFSEKTLVIFKWALTLFFVLVFMFINAFLIKLITGNQAFFKWTMILYAFFFILSFIIYAIGKFTGTVDQAYGVSRKLVGGLQSLVPLMILVPASWLITNKKSF